MADDEDVIFENSPLYRHLSEVGFTDFHAETLTDGNERPELIINEHLKQNDGENLANRNLKERAINSARRFIYRYFLPSTVSEEISCYSFCVAMIKSSGLLADDDLELLYRYEQCTDTEYILINTDIIPVEVNKLTKANNSVFFNLVTNKCMIGIMLLIAIILSLLLKYANSSELKILSYIFLSILSIWLLSQLYFLHAKNKIYILKKNVTLLVDYIKFTEKLLVLKRKVILFIQEKELVAHGHIIVNPAAPVTRLESQIKQCMMLRKCLSIEMNRYLGLLYIKIKDVSHSRFHSTDHENLNWLRKELSRIENQCLTESEKNLQANEYSLSTLKKIYATLGSRQSSLLCCIAVNLMLVITYLKHSQRKQDASCQFYSCLEYLLDEGKKCFDNLNECYKFHKVEIPAHIFDENQVHVPSNDSVYSPFTLALHSMTLHLQQACKTSVEIEKKLDKLITESTELPTCSDFDEINSQVLLIGQEIEKLNVCYEESQSRLEEIALRSSEKQTVENMVEEKANGSSIEQEERHVQILNFGEEAEPVPDQIFEGETTADHDVETQYSSSLGREELWREEKMREEGRHLLKELKFVLATKDEEKMVAIPKVLLKKYGAVKSEARVGNTMESEETESSEVDTADSVSSSVFEPSQSEIEEQDCVDKEGPLKSCDTDLTVKEHAVSMIPAITNPPKNADQSSPGSHDNAAGITNENSDVVYEPSNECNVNVHTAQISHANPFASMVAAAAAARNRQFGAMEESYEIEAETFGDESDTD